MKVFTTVFLADPPIAIAHCLDQANGVDEHQQDVVEFEQALSERITILERRDWLVGSASDEE
jgi:hypothetical protein